MAIRTDFSTAPEGRVGWGLLYPIQEEDPSLLLVTVKPATERSAKGQTDDW